MPVSKRSYKRKMKLRGETQKREKWVKKKVAEFNALPEEAKMGLMQKWSLSKKKEEGEANAASREVGTDQVGPGA